MTTSNLVGEIKAVSGVAIVQGADGLNQLAIPGMKLSLNDLVLTSGQAHVDIQLADGSMTNIAPDSAISIDAKDAAIIESYDVNLSDIFADLTTPVLPVAESSKITLVNHANTVADVSINDVSEQVFSGYQTNPIDTEFYALAEPEQAVLINKITPKLVNTDSNTQIETVDETVTTNAAPVTETPVALDVVPIPVPADDAEITKTSEEIYILDDWRGDDVIMSDYDDDRWSRGDEVDIAIGNDSSWGDDRADAIALTDVLDYGHSDDMTARYDADYDASSTALLSGTSVDAYPMEAIAVYTAIADPMPFEAANPAALVA